MGKRSLEAKKESPIVSLPRRVADSKGKNSIVVLYRVAA